MKTLLVGGIELALVDRGAGPPVVLVHGFPLDHSMWNAQIEALSKTHRVIAPDLRGFGRSRMSAGAYGPGATATMEQFADDLAGLLDALGVAEPVAICGLSMGGYIALRFVRKHRSRLNRLILCDTKSLGDTPEIAAGRRLMAARVLVEGPTPLVEAMIPRLFAPATAKDRPAVVESLRRVMMGNDPRAIAAAALGMAERPDATVWLPEIDCPTLVIVGKLDAISPPAEMRAVVAAIPAAQYVEIAGAGHMTNIEKPEEFNAAVERFLEDAKASRAS